MQIRLFAFSIASRVERITPATVGSATSIAVNDVDARESGHDEPNTVSDLIFPSVREESARVVMFLMIIEIWVYITQA